LKRVCGETRRDATRLLAAVVGVEATVHGAAAAARAAPAVSNPVLKV
jgi:hypothetical protein